MIAAMPIESTRSWLRQQRRWLEIQQVRREGFGLAWRRRAVRPGGPVEVHMLTWRRDWINRIRALKTFYHFAGVDYPLYIHDGGLEPGQAEKLLAHFPDAALAAGGFLESQGGARADR